MEKKRESILAISKYNAESNFPQLLDTIDVTVSTMPNINLYIFELVQNSIDGGASVLQFQVGGNFGLLLFFLAIIDSDFPT